MLLMTVFLFIYQPLIFYRMEGSWQSNWWFHWHLSRIWITAGTMFLMKKCQTTSKIIYLHK